VADTPFQKFPSLCTLENALEKQCQQHLALALEILQSADGRICETDLFIQALLHRSLSIHKGIILLVKDWNLACAGALIRLQLDNLMRAFVVLRAPGGHLLVRAICIEGKPLYHVKDQDGKRLTDHRLRTLCSRHYPWLDRTYQETSKFIHFSQKHVLQTVEKINRPEESVSMCISGTNENCREEHIEEMLACLKVTTVEIFKMCKSWMEKKQRLASDQEAHSAPD